MEDLMGKINEVLSDEESKRQLTELLQMLTSGDFQNESKQSEDNSEDKSEDSPCEIPDIGSIMKLTELMSVFSQNDKNSELLLALKPHLRDEKQKRVEKAVKILKLIAVFNMAKDNGMLDGLI